MRGKKMFPPPLNPWVKPNSRNVNPCKDVVSASSGDDEEDEEQSNSANNRLLLIVGKTRIQSSRNRVTKAEKEQLQDVENPQPSTSNALRQEMRRIYNWNVNGIKKSAPYTPPSETLKKNPQSFIRKTRLPRRKKIPSHDNVPPKKVSKSSILRTPVTIPDKIPKEIGCSSKSNDSRRKTSKSFPVNTRSSSSTVTSKATPETIPLKRVRRKFSTIVPAREVILDTESVKPPQRKSSRKRRERKLIDDKWIFT